MILRTIGSVDLILGEVRDVYIDIVNDQTPDFRFIGTPTWVLYKKKSDEIESEGDCTVTGEESHTLIAPVEPQSRGTYYLVYTYKIADETLKARVEVKVS